MSLHLTFATGRSAHGRLLEQTDAAAGCYMRRLLCALCGKILLTAAN
jgi:hypothetical protein